MIPRYDLFLRFKAHRRPPHSGHANHGVELCLDNQVISNTGFESPCSTKVESYRVSPLETPSALCPPQEAGFTLNKKDCWPFSTTEI